jgi:quercetin dioxygenase-like cupin family protein
MTTRKRLTLALSTTALCLALLGVSPGHTQEKKPAAEAKPIEVARAGSQPSTKGKAEWFTGSVRIDPLFEATAPARASGASVTFEPGARTAWHTHPAGQVLVVTAGAGWVQQWGQKVQEMKPGDVVRIPAGAKHWHGATDETSVTHIAIHEAVDGTPVEWLEHVTDDQYKGK